MAVAYVFIGILVATASSLAALVGGASFWSAVLAYSLGGTASLVLLLTAQLARGAAEAEAVGATESPDMPGSSGSASAPQRRAAMAEVAMRILAVDDDEFVRELIPRIAAKVINPDITTASSGEEALALLQSAITPFDCLLLDINMPGMDGIELCERVRSMSAYRDTPIIMLTAMTDIDHLERAFRAGATDYTSKPFDIIEFGDRLRIAQAQVAATRIEPEPAEATGSSGREQSGGADWRTPRPKALAGVTALITPDAFENYLKRLRGSTLVDAYVMAVAVEPTCKAQRHNALTQVALSIDSVFIGSPFVMTYGGDGYFLLLSHAHGTPNPFAIEAAIEDRLALIRGWAAGSDSEDIAVSVGAPVRPGGNRAHRSRSAIDSAIMLARNRATGRKSAPRGSNGRASI